MIYILEFEQPVGTPRHSARYYIGWAQTEETLHRRVDYHRLGQGAAITRAAADRGINMRLVAILPGDKHEERRLKNLKNTPRLVKQLTAQGRVLQ